MAEILSTYFLRLRGPPLVWAMGRCDRPWGGFSCEWDFEGGGDDAGATAGGSAQGSWAAHGDSQEELLPSTKHAALSANHAAREDGALFARWGRPYGRQSQWAATSNEAEAPHDFRLELGSTCEEAEVVERTLHPAQLQWR
jgi:hypothetical protein